jgi:hypothetical protein
MFSYPLLAYPARSSFDGILNRFVFKNEDLEVSWQRRVLEATGIFLLSYCVAILPIGIGVVFGISGATVGNMVVSGLPCSFYIILDEDEREKDPLYTRPWWFYRVFSKRKIAPLVLFVLSLVLTILGLLSIIGFTILGGLDEALGST